MRIVVSGGGTAGHISPILATVDALALLAAKHHDRLDLLYIGQGSGLEAKIAAASGLEFASIPAGKFRRLHGASWLRQVTNFSTLGQNGRDLFRLIGGVAVSLRILRRWRPDVVFIKGGFVGLPVGLAAGLLRIPYVVHESDLVPGLANRVLGRWAVAVAVGFPVKNYHDFDPKRLVFTGNMVRRDILGVHRLAGLARFKLSDGLPVLLVMGGSQGARAINDCLVPALPELLKTIQVLHLTGEQELERVQFQVKRMGGLPFSQRYHPLPFLMNGMAEALAAADVVVSRAGAQTIAELAALSKPSILIPNYLQAGHQEANAKLLSRAGAALLLDERRLSTERLIDAVRSLIGTPETQERLGRALHRFYNAEAPGELAALIWGCGQVKHNYSRKGE